MAKTQHRESGGSSPHPDLLAAVVLHTLITNTRKGMTASDVAAACERDPRDAADMEEIHAALEILLDDGLAQHKDGLFEPTRSAIRASELSF